MMSHRYRIVSPPARVHAHAHWNQVAPVVVLVLLTLVAWVATITVVHSGRSVLGDLAPGWPWW